MILSYQSIVKNLKFNIDPFNYDHVNSASYDVTLSSDYKRIYSDSCGSYWGSPQYNIQDNIQDNMEEIILKSNEIILASTIERVYIPAHISADFKLKSSIGRRFVNHMLSGWVDPGFNGHITLELHNCGPSDVVLKVGERIGQLVFMRLDFPTSKPYAGKYQHQVGATEER